MFEMLIASGALRTGDGPDALAIIGRRVSELASVAPEDVAAQPPLEALMPWFKIVFADGGEVQPAALALHDLGIFKTGDYDT